MCHRHRCLLLEGRRSDRGQAACFVEGIARAVCSDAALAARMPPRQACYQPRGECSSTNSADAPDRDWSTIGDLLRDRPYLCRWSVRPRARDYICGNASRLRSNRCELPAWCQQSPRRGTMPGGSTPTCRRLVPASSLTPGKRHARPADPAVGRAAHHLRRRGDAHRLLPLLRSSSLAADTREQGAHRLGPIVPKARRREQSDAGKRRRLAAPSLAVVATCGRARAGCTALSRYDRRRRRTPGSTGASARPDLAGGSSPGADLSARARQHRLAGDKPWAI
jgi:hypothetical protein